MYPQSTSMCTAEHSSTVYTPSQATPSARHHAETRHPGTADAAHRHARAGLRERNGPKPTRGARATRPATSQHRVGRRRRGSDERRRTLVCERASGRPRFLLLAPMSLLFTGKKRSLGVGLGVALEDPNRARQTPPAQRSTPTCLPNPSRKKIRPPSRRPPTPPFGGGAPPPPMWATPHRLRRGRIDEMDTSRKPSTRPERRPSLQALR